MRLNEVRFDMKIQCQKNIFCRWFFWDPVMHKSILPILKTFILAIEIDLIINHNGWTDFSGLLVLRPNWIFCNLQY